ncbi:MAG: helix-hairpin-helix domain-containing protein [Chitinivibrionia bacterium]|nr:helix-hairpin-helix domain-containing protein [Chitinivibrionia bacterium]
MKTHIRIICIWALAIAGLWVALYLKNTSANPIGVVIAQEISLEEQEILFDEQTPVFGIAKETKTGAVKKTASDKTTTTTKKTTTKKPAAKKTAKGSVLVNINTAGINELSTLPGIGPAMAQRIIDYRKENGNFAKAEDLKKVSGIGEKKFDAIKELLLL